MNGSVGGELGRAEQRCRFRHHGRDEPDRDADADPPEQPMVAEGVEENAQLQFLRTHQCDEVQGYFFAKPLPPDEFSKYVQQQMRLDNSVSPIRAAMVG